VIHVVLLAVIVVAVTVARVMQPGRGKPPNQYYAVVVWTLVVLGVAIIDDNGGLGDVVLGLLVLVRAGLEQRALRKRDAEQ